MANYLNHGGKFHVGTWTATNRGCHEEACSTPRPLLKRGLPKSRERNGASRPIFGHRLPRSSVLTQCRVVFRLKGNRYRLVALVRFASESSPRNRQCPVDWHACRVRQDRCPHPIRGLRAQEPDHEHSTDPVRRRLRAGHGQNRVTDGPRRPRPGTRRTKSNFSPSSSRPMSARPFQSTHLTRSRRSGSAWIKPGSSPLT